MVNLAWQSSLHDRTTSFWNRLWFGIYVLLDLSDDSFEDAHDVLVVSSWGFGKASFTPWFGESGTFFSGDLSVERDQWWLVWLRFTDGKRARWVDNTPIKGCMIDNRNPTGIQILIWKSILEIPSMWNEVRQSRLLEHFQDEYLLDHHHQITARWFWLPLPPVHQARHKVHTSDWHQNCIFKLYHPRQFQSKAHPLRKDLAKRHPENYRRGPTAIGDRQRFSYPEGFMTKIDESLRKEISIAIAFWENTSQSSTGRSEWISLFDLRVWRKQSHPLEAYFTKAFAEVCAIRTTVVLQWQ